jgi:hypothetical protein
MFKEDLYNSAQAAEEAKPFASSALHSYRFSRGRLAIQARSQQTGQPQRHPPVRACWQNESYSLKKTVDSRMAQVGAMGD